MALDVSRVRALCFDVDGTLSDTDDQWVASFERRLLPLRRLFPRGEVRPFARWAIMCAESPGNLIYHLLDRTGLDSHVGRVFDFLARRQVGRQSSKFLIVDGVREALLILRQHYLLAVVSARGEDSTRCFLQQYDLEDLFPVVATALTCPYTKPFPDPILWAAKQMGVAPEDCLMIGDTTVDIRAGRQAGAQTVGVLCGFGQESELRRAGAGLILPSPAALVGVLLATSGVVENVNIE